MKPTNKIQTHGNRLRHLIGIEGLSTHIILALFEKASRMQQNTEFSLDGTTVINAFFEPSTRTQCSFELAAKRLGATVLNFNETHSATQKGETFLDTIKTLVAMGADAVVIRHPKVGAAHQLVEEFGDDIAIINAGDGDNAHPTQALLDAYTVSKHKNNFNTLSIAIIGDIKHSRVARSQIQIYKQLGVNDIRLVGPKELVPDEFKKYGVDIYHDLEHGIKDCDVVNMLRIQFERMKQAYINSNEEYFEKFGLTSEKLKLAKPDAIVMHPGPMNREVEIASDVADGAQSVILEQVYHGVLIRMAALDTLINRA